MKIGAAGLALIKSFEGLRLTAYLCPAGVPTIGYGHTGLDVSHADVAAKWTITEAQAEEILRRDLGRFEKAVASCIARPLTQNQFDAMVSLAFNIGAAAFRGSSVVRRFNAGRTTEAADAFLLWNKAGGKVLPGLVRRREAERALFLKP